MEWVAELERLFCESVERLCAGEDRISVVYSSGVDSALVAFEASKHSEVTAYNVAVEGSHDELYAKKYESMAPFKIEYVTLSIEKIEELIPEVISVSKSESPLDIGVGIPFYCGSKAASEDGFGKILCGQGGDELFGGYWRYLEALVKDGPDAVMSCMENDWVSAYKDNLDRDIAMCRANNVELLFPYLDEKFSTYVRKMPFDLKIREDADIVCDEISSRWFARKYALKKLALRMGLPDYLVNRTKKAAQYGSGTNKALDKIMRKNGFREKASKAGRNDPLKMYIEEMAATVLKKG